MNLSVLHIILDDARADFGAFGQTHVATPAIDGFASSALQFTNAYAQVALCCPSRGSFLSGRRPASNRLWNVDEGNWRHSAEGAYELVSLPQAFKQAGWHTMSFGKVFHPDHDAQERSLSFTAVGNFMPQLGNPVCPGPDGELELTCDTCFCVGTGDFKDRAIAANVSAALKEMATTETRFYIFAGFHLPHESWSVTDAAWDSYDPSAPQMLPRQPRFAAASRPAQAAPHEFGPRGPFGNLSSPTPFTIDTTAVDYLGGDEWVVRASRRACTPPPWLAPWRRRHP